MSKLISVFIVLESLLSFNSVYFFVEGYTLAEIQADFPTINFPELAKYRGEILQDIWIENRDQASHAAKHERELQVCQTLFTKALGTSNVTWPPPKTPPAELSDAYLLGGKAKLIETYYQEQQNGGKGYIWNKKLLDDYRSKPNICGGYNTDICDIVMKKHQNLLTNRTGIVIGSQHPWVEAALMNAGSKRVITIEYMKITTEYPGLSAMHPSEVAKFYLTKKWHPVDFAVSYSSLEHDGLGRYGDPLNPYGDLESIARVRCLLQPGGYFLLGLPVNKDSVVWNAHRVYGKYRLALALLGWKPLDIYPESCDINAISASGACQPFIVLQKPSLRHHQGFAHSST